MQGGPGQAFEKRTGNLLDGYRPVRRGFREILEEEAGQGKIH